MAIDVSLIIPVYNEEANVRPLYDAIMGSLGGQPFSYEIVFVDDGSRDETFARAAALAACDHRVRVVKFRRNYGQTPAMAAGIRLARGDILVTLDGDLQNDPADIPVFVETIRQGFDIVIGWRHKRQDDFARVHISKIANRIIAWVTGLPVKDAGCSLKAYRADLIKGIPLYSEMHRFIPAMTSLAGARLAQLKVRHHPRRFGKSKYGFARTYKVLLDIFSVRFILTFVERPLLWHARAFGISAAIGTVLLIIALVEQLYGGASTSVAFVGSGILFLALAMSLFFMTLIGHLSMASADFRIDEFPILTSRSADLARPSGEQTP